MGEFRPPEPHQQEILTPWQLMSFEREVAEKVSKGMAPPRSPLNRKDSQSRLNSLSSQDSEFLKSSDSISLLDKHQFFEKRMKRLEKGVEMSDMTPRSTNISVHSRQLKSAKNLSRTNRSPPKTRGKAVVHSVLTGNKFDINIARNHLKASTRKSSTSRSFLAPTVQKMELSEKRKSTNQLPPMQGDRSLTVVDLELRSYLKGNAGAFDVDEVSLQSHTSN